MKSKKERTIKAWLGHCSVSLLLLEGWSKRGGETPQRRGFRHQEPLPIAHSQNISSRISFLRSSSLVSFPLNPMVCVSISYHPAPARCSTGTLSPTGWCKPLALPTRHKHCSSSSWFRCSPCLPAHRPDLTPEDISSLSL